MKLFLTALLTCCTFFFINTTFAQHLKGKVTDKIAWLYREHSALTGTGQSQYVVHEIQNPLNFVNNFSEVNNELIEELKAKRSTLKAEEQDELLNDIFQNNEKIAMHDNKKIYC